MCARPHVGPLPTMLPMSPPRPAASKPSTMYRPSTWSHTTSTTRTISYASFSRYMSSLPYLLSIVKHGQSREGRAGREGHDRWTKIRYYLHATDFLVFIIPLQQILFVTITVYMLVVEVSVMHSRREYYCNACVRCGRLILIPNHRFSNALQSNVTRKDIAGLL